MVAPRQTYVGPSIKDRPRLDLIAQVACSPHETFTHWSGFLIAEVDGEPVGA